MAFYKSQTACQEAAESYRFGSNGGQWPGQMNVDPFPGPLKLLVGIGILLVAVENSKKKRRY